MPRTSTTQRRTAATKVNLSQQPSDTISVTDAVDQFLAGLDRSDRSSATRRAYASDLRRLIRLHPGALTSVTPDVIGVLLEEDVDLAMATRLRRRAAVASFLGWCRRQEFMDHDPMARLEPLRLPFRLPRALPEKDVQRILAAIPTARVRDRLLFGLAYSTGARIGELLQLDADDVDLTRDDEHLLLKGKGNRQRRILIADPKLVVLLRRHMKTINHGPVFRAEYHDTGRPLTYQSAHARWTAYCQAAGVTGTIHQLRHAHGTQLVNAGVPLAVIRKRLGHRRIDTTLLYAEVSDPVSDQVLRDWRRSKK